MTKTRRREVIKIIRKEMKLKYREERGQISKTDPGESMGFTREEMTEALEWMQRK